MLRKLFRVYDFATVPGQTIRSTVVMDLIVWGSISVSTILTDPIRISEMYHLGAYDNTVM